MNRDFKNLYLPHVSTLFFATLVLQRFSAVNILRYCASGLSALFIVG